MSSVEEQEDVGRRSSIAGRFGDALGAFQKVAEIRRLLLGADHLNTVIGEYDLVFTCSALRKHEDALAVVEANTGTGCGVAVRAEDGVGGERGGADERQRDVRAGRMAEQNADENMRGLR